MLLVPVLLVLAGAALLYLGGEWLITGAVQLARRSGLEPIVIGLTVVAFGTSAPELAATLSAAFAGTPDVGFGNVIGSNIANVGLILGIAALIRPIAASAKFLFREMPFMIGTGVLMVLLVLDRQIGHWEGILLLALLAGYLWYLFSRSETADEPLARELEDEVADEPEGTLGGSLARITAGIVGLVIGAELLVDGAVTIAHAFGTPERVIGLTLVAFGTSLPELASAIVAALRREGDLLLGNIVGSNVFNVLAIMGTTASIIPLSPEDPGIWIDLAVMVGSGVLLWGLLATHRGLERWEGALLLAGYLGYLGWLFV